MADQNVTMSLDVLPGSLAGITTAAAGFGQLIGSAAVFTKMITKSTSAADSFALTLTAGLGLVAVESSKAFGEFERAMKVAQVVSDQTNRDMSILGKSINDFSVQYRMSIDNMTDGLQTLGRAGLKSVNTQIEVLETGLGAAKLSGLELNNVLEKIVQTTSLLGGELKSTDFGRQVEDVTDKMIATSMTAPITMEDVVQTLSFSGGTAAAGGMNIQNPDKLYDYLGAISAFAQKGVTGSIAGTALRAFFTKPAAQDKSVVDALGKINLNPEDLWENHGQRMKSISDQIGMIHKAMEKNNMSTLDQIELWGDIVGAKMGQQMMKLDEKTIRDTAKDIRAMSNSQDLAKASLQNYASDVSQLEQQLMVIWRQIGEGFASILDNKSLGDWSSLIKMLTKIAELFSSDWGIFTIRTAIIGLVSYLSSRLVNVLSLFKQMGSLLKSQLTDSQRNTKEIEKENAAVKEQQARFGLTRAQTQALARSTGEVNGELNISNNILTEFLRKLNQITEVMRRLHLEVEALNYSQVQNVTSGQYSRFFKGKNPDLQKKEMTKLSRYFGLNMGDLYDIYESDDFRSYTAGKRRSFDKYPFYTASDLKTYINDKNLSPLTNSHDNYFQSIDAAVSGIRGEVEQQTQEIKTAAGQITGSLGATKQGPRGQSSHVENMMDYTDIDMDEIVEKYNNNPDASLLGLINEAYREKANKINSIYDQAVAKAEKELIIFENENGGFITAYDYEKEKNVMYTRDAYFNKLQQDREKALTKLFGLRYDEKKDRLVPNTSNFNRFSIMDSMSEEFLTGDIDDETKEPIKTTAWNIIQKELTEAGVKSNIPGPFSRALMGSVESPEFTQAKEKYDNTKNAFDKEIQRREENQKDLVKIASGKKYSKDIVKGAYAQRVGYNIFDDKELLGGKSIDDFNPTVAYGLIDEIIQDDEVTDDTKKALMSYFLRKEEAAEAYTNYQKALDATNEAEAEFNQAVKSATEETKSRLTKADIDYTAANRKFIEQKNKVGMLDALLTQQRERKGDEGVIRERLEDYEKRLALENENRMAAFKHQDDEYRRAVWDANKDEIDEWIEDRIAEENRRGQAEYDAAFAKYTESKGKFDAAQKSFEGINPEEYVPPNDIRARTGVYNAFDALYKAANASVKGAQLFQGKTTLFDLSKSGDDYFGKGKKRMKESDVISMLLAPDERHPSQTLGETIAQALEQNPDVEDNRWIGNITRVLRNEKDENGVGLLEGENAKKGLSNLISTLAKEGAKEAYGFARDLGEAPPEKPTPYIPIDNLTDEMFAELNNELIPELGAEMGLERPSMKKLKPTANIDKNVSPYFVKGAINTKREADKAREQLARAKSGQYDTVPYQGEIYSEEDIENERKIAAELEKQKNNAKKSLDKAQQLHDDAVQKAKEENESVQNAQKTLNEAKQKIKEIFQVEFDNIQQTYRHLRAKGQYHFDNKAMQKAVGQAILKSFDNQKAGITQAEVDAFLESEEGQKLYQQFLDDYDVQAAIEERDKWMRKNKEPTKDKTRIYKDDVEKQYSSIYGSGLSNRARERRYEEYEKHPERYNPQPVSDYERRKVAGEMRDTKRYHLVNYDELKKDYDNYAAALEARGMEAQSIGSYIASRTETKYLDDKMTGGKAGIYTLPKGTLESLHTTALTFDKDAKIVEDNVASGIKHLITLSEEFEKTAGHGFKDDTYMGPESGSYFGREGEEYLRRELDLGGKSARNWLGEGLSNAGTNFLIGLGAGRIDENGEWAPNARDKGKSKFRVALSHWMGMGMYGNIFSGAKGAIGKLPTNASTMSKAMAGFGGALAGLGTFMGPLEVGMMLVNGAMQLWAQQQQAYNEKLADAISRFSEIQSDLEDAEDQFMEEYEKKNKKATQEQKDEAYLNALYTSYDKNDGLDNYRHKLYDKVTLISMNVGKVSKTLEDKWFGPAGALNQNLWTPLEKLGTNISNAVFKTSRGDEYNKQVTDEQDYYKDLFETNNGQDLATYSGNEKLDEVIASIDNNTHTKQTISSGLGISSTPVFEATGRHDTSAKLAHEQKNISEQHAAASGQMIDDWNDMSRAQATWIEDIEDFSEQTRYATHVAFEGIDALAPQAHAYRNIFGSNGLTQSYYDFESDLMSNSQRVRLRMATALNQMPDYFISMQRMYFGTKTNKYGKLSLVGDTKAKQEAREDKILTNIAKHVGGITKQQAKQLLVLSSISQINQLVKDTIEPQLITQTEASMAAALSGGITAGATQNNWTATEAVNAGVSVISAQLATVVQAKVMEIQGYEATAAGMDLKDVYAVQNADQAGQDISSGKIDGLDHTLSQQQIRDARNIGSSGYKGYYQTFMSQLGMDKEDIEKHSQELYDQLKAGGLSSYAMWNTIKKYGTWAGERIINEKYAETLGEQIQEPSDGTGSGDSDNDKDKDTNKNRKNWVNLAICNKKEIPKLNVNLFKKPPNFTILNRNFKLRDVNVNTADDAKSIQNAVKNSIIEIQNRSNPKIIQDDAAEYDPVNATEGNNLPTGTKKTE